MRSAMSCSTWVDTQIVTSTIGLGDSCSFPTCIMTKEHALCKNQVTVQGRVESKQAPEGNPNKSAELVQTLAPRHGSPIWQASCRRLPTLASLADMTNVLQEAVALLPFGANQVFIQERCGPCLSTGKIQYTRMYCETKSDTHLKSNRLDPAQGQKDR